tara:strand:+ start:60 stop:623 length:564 start_codon:yes stop_codon:yes gene_type:complete
MNIQTPRKLSKKAQAQAQKSIEKINPTNVYICAGDSHYPELLTSALNPESYKINSQYAWAEKGEGMTLMRISSVDPNKITNAAVPPIDLDAANFLKMLGVPLGYDYVATDVFAAHLPSGKFVFTLELRDRKPLPIFFASFCSNSQMFKKLLDEVFPDGRMKNYFGSTKFDDWDNVSKDFPDMKIINL